MAYVTLCEVKKERGRKEKGATFINKTKKRKGKQED
jgi:hypothetical protein